MNPTIAGKKPAQINTLKHYNHIKEQSKSQQNQNIRNGGG